MVRCIDDENDDYDKERRIQNARFDLRPALICHCTTEQEVGEAIKRAQQAKPKRLPIRIRAGGHHHEGMCSGNDVLMIDVSGMADIDVDTTTGIVRVGPGAKNGAIYDALWYAPRGPRRVFPRFKNLFDVDGDFDFEMGIPGK
jgi:FAD/FMN-containing dehydrogenase